MNKINHRWNNKQRGWNYWQRPSDKNATGVKRGRLVPGENTIGRKRSMTVEEPGEAGHLMDMEGFSPLEKALWSKGK